MRKKNIIPKLVITFMLVFSSTMIYAQWDTHTGEINYVYTAYDGIVVDNNFNAQNSSLWFGRPDNGHSLTFDHGDLSFNFSNRLFIKDRLDIRDKSNENNKLFLGHGGSNAYMSWFGAGNLDFKRNNTDLMTLDQSGKLGIGTTSPLKPLHVVGGRGILTMAQHGDIQVVQGTQSTLNAGWIGTYSAHPLVIGSNNNINNLFLDINNNTLAGFNDNAQRAKITDSMKDDFNFFTYQGVMTLGKLRSADEINDATNNYVEIDHGGSNAYMNWSGAGNLDFRRNNTNLMTLDQSGRLVVGDVTGSMPTDDQILGAYSLYVGKGILTEDIALVKKDYWSDYVFDKKYELKPLSELADFIKKNKHLPNIPSQKTISEEGYSIHDMNVLFLEKIEELTLYILQQEERIEELSKKLDSLGKGKVN